MVCFSVDFRWDNCLWPWYCKGDYFKSFKLYTLQKLYRYIDIYTLFDQPLFTIFKSYGKIRHCLSTNYSGGTITSFCSTYFIHLFPQTNKFPLTFHFQLLSQISLAVSSNEKLFEKPYLEKVKPILLTKWEINIKWFRKIFSNFFKILFNIVNDFRKLK